MKLLRFIFPFLFKRNWYDGSWEISRTRLIVFIVCITLFLVAIALMYMLQSPVEYSVT